jgi:hypothetical protein
LHSPSLLLPSLSSKDRWSSLSPQFLIRERRRSETPQKHHIRHNCSLYIFESNFHISLSFCFSPTITIPLPLLYRP